VTTATAELLHRDLFPVEAYVPHADPVPHLARAFITNQRIYVWVLDGERVHELVNEPIEGEPPSKATGSFFGQIKVDTEAGPVHLTKATGCGCGSPLRYLSPPVSRQG
jgi:hypothetical protein